MSDDKFGPGERRILTDSMSALGQPFIIENVAGRGGSIGDRPRRTCSSRRLYRQYRPLEHTRRRVFS
jgi:hypothetical protein